MSAINGERKILLISWITGLSLLGDSMLYIILPIYWREAGLESIWQVGILLSINRFVRLPVNPIVGWIYGKISLRTGLLLAVCLAGITTIGYGFANSMGVWVLLRGMWGIAWSFFRIGGLSAVVLYSPTSSRGKLIGRYNGIYRVGNLIGMLGGGLLVPIFGITSISIGFGVISLLGLPILLSKLFITEKIQARKINPRLSEKESFHAQQLSIIISGFFITLLIQGIFISTFSQLVQSQYGATFSLFGWIISASLFSGGLQALRWGWEPFLGSLVGSWSDGRYGRMPLYIGSLVGMGAVFSIVAHSFPLYIWSGFAASIMIGSTFVITLTDAVAADSSKTNRAVPFLTIYSMAQDIGAACGPFISYLLLTAENGFYYLYTGGSIAFLLLSLLWIHHYISSSHEPDRVRRNKRSRWKNTF